MRLKSYSLALHKVYLLQISSEQEQLMKQVFNSHKCSKQIA